MMSKLYLIPVPIAENALHTLPATTVEIAQQLDIFIVERAKTARHFLKSIGIKTPIQEVTVVEIDEKEPDITTETLKSALKSGKSVGLLSEAGCPGVADPGAEVVAMAHQLDMRVQPLTGPSSLLLALMASGMNGQRFTFHGYLSPKRPELGRELRVLEQSAAKNKETQLFIETPYRSTMVLEVALEVLQRDTRLGIAQDITGEGEFIRSMPVKQWRSSGIKSLNKAPAVFLINKK